MAHTLRILLIDCDPGESERISSRLSGARHSVIAASGLEEASEFLEIQRFDAVLLAAQGDDGAVGKFAAKLRVLDAGQRSAAHTPILSLSAPEISHPVYADGCLPPSFDPAALVETVASLAYAVSARQSPLDGELPVFDSEKLSAQAGSDLELVSEIVALFLADQADQFAQMRQALQAGDYPRLSYVAHTIKGSFGTLGAMVCWSCAQQLEYAAKQCDERNCRELLPSLESALHGLLPHLQTLRAAPGRS
ncbi:MAG: Hpt domain-containing protein [Bryobacteraceae bacterium]